MTMGRPLMISHRFSTSPPSPVDDIQLQATGALTTPAQNFPVTGFLLEAIKLSKTLGTILTTIHDQNISKTDANIDPAGKGKARYMQTPAEIDAVLELDKYLAKFLDELPVELRSSQDGENLRRSMGVSVGNLQMQANVLHAR
jgi:hypothetical protein